VGIVGRIFRALDPILSRLPPDWVAAMEYHCRPSLRREWGGPFNGQIGRQALFLELHRTCSFRAIVETGTYRGGTTEFMARRTAVPVYTVESAPRHYHYAHRRLRRCPGVRLELGDSVDFLEKLARDPAVPRDNLFFYLDAHWWERLPLREEIETIRRHWPDSIIMIDDFEVPGDPGYRFDDCGPGKRLGVDILSFLPKPGPKMLFPTCPSSRESGSRKGCVVLADGEAAHRIAGIGLLRAAEAESPPSSETTR